jgi:hypothetical protein
MRSTRPEPERHISATDRIGNGILAGFVATLVLSGLHDPLTVVTEAVGVHAPVAGLLFHFFVGALLWGGVFGFLHDALPGPSWVRGVAFAAGGAVIVLLVLAPLSGAGLFGLKLGLLAPLAVTLFHLAYGAIMGAVYGKLVDTDEARDYLAGHQHR